MKSERHHRALEPRNFEAEQWLIDEVAKTLGVSRRELTSPTRGTANVSRARGIVMYLLHTVVGNSMTASGVCVGRDRTTARHHIRLVEDLRDRQSWDEIIELLETNLKVFVINQQISS